MWRKLLTILSAFLIFGVANQACAEDGYDLWLRYRPLDSAAKAHYRPVLTNFVAPNARPTIRAATDELQRAFKAMFGYDLVQRETVMHDGTVLVTRADSPLLKGMDLPFARLGKEGYLIRSATIGGNHVTIIAGNGDVGALYGTFRFYKLIQTG